ncbi:MAG: hypothetical protein ABJA71_02310 [Ginsengibacter sp.]
MSKNSQSIRRIRTDKTLRAAKEIPVLTALIAQRNHHNYTRDNNNNK